MKWCLIGNPRSQQVLQLIREVRQVLIKRKQAIVIEQRLAAALGLRGTPLEKIDADVYITVGGDGTILLTLDHTDKPVLAINAGGVGFLSEVEPKYATVAIDRILRTDYRVEERTKLACYLDNKRLWDAANEVTVQTAKIAKLIEFRVEINGEAVDTLRGDGIIVATATGSTGYSLSVGGPILHPSVDGVVVSPIAPFRISARPIVVPYSSTIHITLLGRDRGGQEAKVVIDGQRGKAMRAGQVVAIKPCERRARFIRFEGGFYDRVRTKLIR